MVRVSRDDPQNSEIDVFLDGNDISDTCTRFDSDAGWAKLADGTILVGVITYAEKNKRPLSQRRRVGNAYGSHIPVLIGLARMFQIKNVIEFGAGNYSTETFLNCGAFPGLEQLISVEENASWREIFDDRLFYFLSRDELSKGDIKGADLIFVDSSILHRLKDIEFVSKIDDCILVFHDLEDRTYRRATQNIDGLFTFRIFDPFTGVKCNKSLAKLHSFILEHNHIDPTDTESWIIAFQDFETFKPSNCRSCDK